MLSDLPGQLRSKASGRPAGARPPRRTRVRPPTGPLAGALVAAFAATLVLPAAPAKADPAPGSSVIGDANRVDDDDYLSSANPDPGVEAIAGTARDDACTALTGTVTPADAADAQHRLVGQTPTGAGRWRYVVCAETARQSQVVAGQRPGATAAKAYCAAAASRCAVVVVWEPEDRRPPRREQNPPRRLGAFDGWLEFTPELVTSPTDPDALVAQLPTWVWDRVTSDVRGICLPLFGGVCGFAVRLSTSWRTEGRTFCRSPGTPYRPGSDDPRSASSCGWTYATSGRYGITGCKNWLVIVWRLPWYIPIVFPLELCNTDQVGVREAQVMSGGQPR